MSAPDTQASASINSANAAVPKTVHNAIVADLEADLAIAEAFIKTAWATHEVIVVAIVAFLAGALTRLI